MPCDVSCAAALRARRPTWAHSVHVEADNLEPDRWYWYRFRAGDAESPIGRLRTMPADDSNPTELRFAFASCQHFESGLYTAYEHMAKEELDLVFHLGDYIYDGPATTAECGSTSTASSERWKTFACAIRSTKPIRCCRRCTPAARGS